MLLSEQDEQRVSATAALHLRTVNDEKNRLSIFGTISSQRLRMLRPGFVRSGWECSARDGVDATAALPLTRTGPAAFTSETVARQPHLARNRF